MSRDNFGDFLFDLGVTMMKDFIGLSPESRYDGLQDPDDHFTLGDGDDGPIPAICEPCTFNAHDHCHRSSPGMQASYGRPCQCICGGLG